MFRPYSENIKNNDNKINNDQKVTQSQDELSKEILNSVYHLIAKGMVQALEVLLKQHKTLDWTATIKNPVFKPPFNNISPPDTLFAWLAIRGSYRPDELKALDVLVKHMQPLVKDLSDIRGLDLCNDNLLFSGDGLGIPYERKYDPFSCLNP
jgi:hypothetical protein